jgi:hypothetical protein
MNIAPEFSELSPDATRLYFPWELQNVDYVRRALDLVQATLYRMYKEAVREKTR